MKIAYILIPNMLATSVSLPSEMWLSAKQRAFSKGKKSISIEISYISCSEKVIHTHSHLPLNASHTLAEQNTQQLEKFDLIYIPALWRNPKKSIDISQLLFPWLREQYASGAILCGVGTGCCLIAETGLLDFKPATTHWYYFDQFAELYPKVKLKRQHFITQAGQLYCAASINSLADLTIHFIQRSYSKEVSQYIERHYSHEIRRAYEMIKMGLSERQFNRRFVAAVGTSPSQYLQQLRIETAQDLLQYSNLNIGEIAVRVGFNDTSYFAKIFKQNRSISPREYRKTVRAKLFSS